MGKGGAGTEREEEKGQHEFPIAAVTDDHKPAGLKQYTFILSQLWWPEV